MCTFSFTRVKVPEWISCANNVLNTCTPSFILDTPSAWAEIREGLDYLCREKFDGKADLFR